MNIALLTKNFGKDMNEAAKITTVNLAKDLTKNNHNVSIISNRGYIRGFSKFMTPSYEKVEGVDVFRPYYVREIPSFNLTPMTIFNRFLSQPFGVLYVEKKREMTFDIVHSNSSAPVLALNSIFCKFFKRDYKIVHTLKSYSVHPLGSFFFSKILNYTDKVIVPLESMKQELISNGVKENKIEIIHSNIDIDKFRPMNKEKLKKKYGLSNKKVILYYGHASERKGVPKLLKIYKKLKKNMPDVVMYLLFSGRTHPKYNNLSEEGFYAIGNARVKIEEYVSLSDVAIFPYETLVGTEANPSCVLECMASETPVVTSRVDGMEVIGTENEHFLCSKPNDINGFVKNIKKLLNDPKLVKYINHNALAKSKEFGIKNSTKKHITLYENLLK